MTISEAWWKQLSKIHNYWTILLLTLFFNYNHHFHNHNYHLQNRLVHNYNYRLHNNHLTTTWISMIQCLYITTLKHKSPLTFILHTHNYYPKMILFPMPNKLPLTSKTISPHKILRHPHNNHKHQTEMNISSLTKIPLYNFMKKTWMILVNMRINSSLITSMTKAMTRVLADQRHLHWNITNLGVQWSWTLTTYDTILFNNKIVYNHQPVHSRLAWTLMKKHNVFECWLAIKKYNTTLEIIVNAKKYILTREG